MSDSMIKTIEDLSLNAWPSHQIQFYDGWLLRFSYFYTHRTNCVEQLGASTINIEEKISYTEDTYRRWGTPSIFKISPLMDPSFDSFLAFRGYITEHITHNMILELNHAAISAPLTSTDVSNSIPLSWISALFSLKGTTNVMHKQVVPSMYRAIPKETIAVSIRDNDRIIGTGLGILDREYIGIYAIHVHPDFRGRHLAHDIVSTILLEGWNRGATHAYLQVVDGNAPAIHLYQSFGFHRLYTDSFRVKELFTPQGNH